MAENMLLPMALTSCDHPMDAPDGLIEHHTNSENAQGTALANITRAVPPLPYFVWCCIASQLTDSPLTLFNLATVSPDLQEICRPQISLSFQRITCPCLPIWRRFYYHRLLQLVLEGYLDPAYIYEFYCLAPYEGPRPLATFDTAARRFFSDTLPGRTTLSQQQMLKFDTLLEGAVDASPYILAEQKTAVCQRFFAGDPDAALAILLPLCTKLKMLAITDEVPLCALVFEKVAQEHHRRETRAEDARSRASDIALRDRDTEVVRKKPAMKNAVPFSELLIFQTIDPTSWSGAWCLPLTSLLHFISLPSLHRVILEMVHDHDFPTWPSLNTICTAPEIYFHHSSVTRRAALAFAEGLQAPCEIRQWFARDPDWSDRELHGQPDWDRLLVRESSDGGRTVTASLEDEGCYPGYEHAWISWLWHGKLEDWRRLDQEFQGREGDGEIMEFWN